MLIHLYKKYIKVIVWRDEKKEGLYRNKKKFLSEIKSNDICCFTTNFCENSDTVVIRFTFLCLKRSETGIIKPFHRSKISREMRLEGKVICLK